jgi:NAD(P)H-quinone oxidoreductase subunit 5
MEQLFSVSAYAILFIPLLVSALGFIKLQQNSVLMRRLSVGGAAISFLSALVLAAGVIQRGAYDGVLGVIGNPDGFHFSLGILIDRLSVLSVFLITSIGLIVQRYSLRYLDGDPRQGRFFTWLSFVLFSVTFFVISRNLLALTFTWFLGSSGIHQLLLHFAERESAQKAAWRKFVISRIGDGILLVALVLTYQLFGTFELNQIFEMAADSKSQNFLHLLGLTIHPYALVGSLYVLGAMTKSAQFPFHIWLPDTMETPTPVSALMHAGIINAGGFLIVRLSPLVGHASFSLHLLFILGAFTALFAGLIYLVQTDIKRSLAYSTIAQMGYMMMQCGLGAFAAAMLHLIMHGYYKAHAFLSAAGRIESAPLFYDKNSKVAHFQIPLPTRILAAVLSLLLLAASLVVFEVNISEKPGGLFLSLFLWISAVQALAPALTYRVGVRPILTVSFLVFLGMGLYWGALGVISQFLSPVVGSSESHGFLGELNPVLLIGVGVLFVVIYSLAEWARQNPEREIAKRLYVLCLNHFYIEQAWRKMVQGVVGKTKLMPSFETLAIQKDLKTYQ